MPQRQNDGKACAASSRPRDAAQADPSAMLMDDSHRQPEPQAGSLELLGGEKSIEDVLADVLRNTAPVIANQHADAGTHTAGAQADFSSLRHGFQSIGKQVREHLL